MAVSRDLNHRLPLAVIRHARGFALFAFSTCTGWFLVLMPLGGYLLKHRSLLITLVSLTTILTLITSLNLTFRVVRASANSAQDAKADSHDSEDFSRIRRKLQRDLHDGLGPTITAANMRIETARRLLDDDPEVADELLAQANVEIDYAVYQMRRLIRHLHLSCEETEQGLDQAIKKLGAQFQEASGGQLRVIVDCPPLDPKVTNKMHEELYFIAREAITNVVRHAHATTCLIKLISSTSGITLTVRDNGVGFYEPGMCGVGLKSMQERASEWGGACIIIAHPEGGILVEAFLPWNHGDGERRGIIADESRERRQRQTPSCFGGG